MTTTTRRALAVLATAALALVACSNSDDDAAGDETTTSEAASSSSAGSSEAAGGDDTSTTVAEGDGGDEGGNDPTEFVPIEGVPGVSDESIDFAMVSTGPANPLGTCYLECYQAGIEAYFAYRNDEGGLFGRQLQLTRPVDDNLGETQVRVLEILDADDTFGIFAQPLIVAGFGDIADAGVPLWTTFVQAPDVAGMENAFAIGGVNCIACAAKYHVYVPQAVGATRVASLGYGSIDASAACAEGQAASYERWGADAGLELVYSNDDLQFGLPNGIGPEVTAMIDADVEVILTCLDANATADIARELERQGASDMVMVLPSDGYGSPDFLTNAGGLFDGDVMSVLYRPFEADTEGTGTELYRQWMEETGHPDLVGLNSAAGWLDADIAYSGILAAGAEFDRQSVIDATNGLEDYTANGMTPPVDFGRQHVSPTDEDPVTNGSDPSCLAFVRIVGDGYELLSGTPEAPWACWDPADPDYAEPTPTGFE